MKLKTFISILLAFVMLVSATPVYYAAEPESNLIKIPTEVLSTKSVIASDFGSGQLFTVTFDTSTYDDKYTLSVYNADDASLIKQKTVKSSKIPLECITECEVNEDGTYSLYDNYEGKSAVYNPDLTLKEKSTCEVVSYDYTELGKNNKLLDRFFYKEAEFARCNETTAFTEPITAMAFYDDDSCVYLTDDSEVRSIYANYGKKMFVSLNSASKNKVKAGIYDYSLFNNVTVETPSFEGYDDNSIITGEMDETRVFFVVESCRGDVYYSTMFIWKYSDETEYTPFNATKLTAKTVKKMNNEYVSNIKTEYDINILIDKLPSTYPTYWDDEAQNWYGGVEKGANVFDTYVLLNQLYGYLACFPKNFTREMKYFGGKDHSFDIYIDKNIIGSAAAFANRYDGFLICFATQEFSADFIPHEFLHLIDARIDDYLEKKNKSYETEWDKLNPSDFYYYEDQEFQPKYFASAYAMTDSREDRADTFEYLFQAYGSDTQPYTYNAVKKKSIYLSELIRKVYPSVRKTDFNVWEKWITPYPEKVKSKPTVNSLKVYWSECRTAQSYELQQKKNGQWVTVSKNANRSYKLSNQKSGKAYSFRVRAFRTSGKHKVYSSWEYIDTATKPQTPKITKISSDSKHRIKTRWKKVKSRTGYQIQYARDKKFKKLVAVKDVAGKSKSYTGKNFTKGRKYYVRIRAYTKSGNKYVYSSWSKAKSVVAE